MATTTGKPPECLLQSSLPIMLPTTRDCWTFPPLHPPRLTMIVGWHATRDPENIPLTPHPPTPIRSDWSSTGMHHWPYTNPSQPPMATTYAAPHHQNANWTQLETSLLWVHSHSVAHPSPTTMVIHHQQHQILCQNHTTDLDLAGVVPMQHPPTANW